MAMAGTLCNLNPSSFGAMQINHQNTPMITRFQDLIFLFLSFYANILLYFLWILDSTHMLTHNN